MTSLDPEIEEARALVRRVTADRRRALRRVLVFGSIVTALLTIWSANRDRVRAYVAGEIDLDGNPRFEPPYPVDVETLAQIDFERVHALRIPMWSIAISRATSEGRRRYADRMFDELAAEVAPDPNLSMLLTASHRALRDDPIGNARRLDYLLWAYNRYLDERGVPYRIEASLAFGHERPIFRTFSYEVLADGRNDEGHRLRLLRRADRTSSLEGWLGHTRGGEEGAIVLTERVLHFTVRHVWPGLHPALDERRPAKERNLLGYVRDEVRAALDEPIYALLAETAGDQQTLIEVAEAVHDRHTCGSRFRIRRLPYNGLSQRSMMAIHRALERSHLSPDCPDITLDEAARIAGASERLASTEGLEDAVERLAMVVMRAVAAHELQHAQDGDEPACFNCPEELTGIARAEVSAYLSAFSTEGLGYLSLLQACATPRAGGIHSAALTAVLEVILPYGCEGPTLHGLYELAERIETHLFGKRGDVALPPLPARVPLLPRRPTAPRPPRAQPLESGWGVSLRQREASRDQSALTP